MSAQKLPGHLTSWGEARRDLVSMCCKPGFWDGRPPPSRCAGMLSALALRGASACSTSHWLLRDLSAHAPTLAIGMVHT